MAATLVALFDDVDQAQKAAAELAAIGISRTDVSITRAQPDTGYATYRGGTVDRVSSQTHKGGIAGFFENLFGSDVEDEERGMYAEAVRRGTTVLTTTVDEAYVERATDILNQFGSVDVDRRAAQYSAAGFKTFDASAPTYTPEETRAELERFGSEGQVELPVVEEQLKVGKRQVQRGGVRVYTRVTERPVEERVNLREERVRVERRPADRAVSDAEVANLRDSEIVVTETAEEAVVAKEARVVEDVVVGKETAERTETVRDTLRRTDVEVEQIGGVATDTGPVRTKDTSW